MTPIMVYVVYWVWFFEGSEGRLGAYNVCKTFAGYYERNGCYFNADYKLEVPDIIRRHGYQAETHNVTTQDGYILQVFRIPSNDSKSTPIFLQHGIYLSAMAFVNTGKQSLALVLADAGYDVWLGNFRGNRYARSHVSLSSESNEFWHFSFHELGIYDVEAQLSLVKTVTGKAVVYVGYSMGSTAGYVYAILNENAAKLNIRTMVSLAPIAYLADIPSIVRLLFPFWFALEVFFNAFSHGEVFGRNSSLTKLLSNVCLPYPHQMFVCQIPLQMAFGSDTDQWNPETLPVTLHQNGDSISTKTVTHYKQILDSNKFQYFDYGPSENALRYKSKRPPLYNLTKIRVPVYLVYAKNDYLATRKNVDRLYGELSNEAKVYGKYVVPYKKFNHADFISGRDVKALLYDHLLSFLANL